MKITGLNHVAIVVSDTEEALRVWRDHLGLPVLFSEEVLDGAFLLTHLDLGNTELQLVEPLNQDHPIANWVKEKGSGLHHIGLAVEDAAEAFAASKGSSVSPDQKELHQGTQGKRAFFLKKETTGGITVEVTGP